MSKDILQKICANRQKQVDAKKHQLPLEEIKEYLASNLEPSRGFITSLQGKIDNSDNAIIAEIKKASPSKGVIREDFDPIEIARAYEDAGASCLSILTEVDYFQGDDSYIKQVKEQSGLPILRKDFIVDEYQIYESKYIGADCILLIAAALGDEIVEYEQIAHQLGMDVLVEVHNEEELQRSLKLNTKLIGINNRDLKTLNISLDNTINLVKQIPSGYTIISESGINTREDIKLINASGVYGFLVGTSLMRQQDIKSALAGLIND